MANPDAGGGQTLDLARQNEVFETATPEEMLAWVTSRFAPDAVLTMSFQHEGVVIAHMLRRIAPETPILFIDTGYHFPETLETVERVRRRYGLNLRIMTVAPHDEELWKVDPENCCSAVKVGQLDRALAGKEAWMSGLRRDEAETRAGSPIVARDVRGLIKVNPLANWTAADVDDYIERHDVPVNPLIDQGYPSIGCQPCTSKVAPGEDPRSGRWKGRGKTECGLHLA